MKLRQRVLPYLYVPFLFLLSFAASACHAQASEGTLSDREVDQLRDASYVPADTISCYVRFLDDREKQLNSLAAGRRYPGRGRDMHDLMEQISGIADELNDHLDDYSKQHRDVRKMLPKLVQATERWSTSLRTPADDADYNIVRRIALDNIKDTRELAGAMETELAAYFAAHPDAAKLEKERRESPHAATSRDPE